MDGDLVKLEEGGPGREVTLPGLYVLLLCLPRFLLSSSLLLSFPGCRRPEAEGKILEEASVKGSGDQLIKQDPYI